mgnify:CR=1 FL=1
MSVTARPYVKPPRHISDRGVAGRLRLGRGFSECELSKAGISVEKARRIGLPLDLRRRSCHEWNIKILKEHLSKLSETS